jgi:hypothetical protein
MQSQAEMLSLPSSLFDIEGKPIGEDLESSLVLARALYVATADSFRTKRRLGWGGLAAFAAGALLFLNSVFSQPYSGSGVVSLAGIVLIVLGAALAAARSLIKPWNIGIVSKLHWTLSIIPFGDRSALIHDPWGLVQPIELTLTRVPIEEMKERMNNKEKIIASWKAENECLVLLKELTDLEKSERSQTVTFHVLGRSSDVPEGLRRLLPLCIRGPVGDTTGSASLAVANWHTNMAEEFLRLASLQTQILREVRARVQSTVDILLTNLKSSTEAIDVYWDTLSFTICKQYEAKIVAAKVFTETIDNLRESITPELQQIDLGYSKKIQDLRREEEEEVGEITKAYDPKIRSGERDVHLAEVELTRAQSRLSELQSLLVSTPKYTYRSEYDSASDSYTTKRKKNPRYSDMSSRVSEASSEVFSLERQLESAENSLSVLKSEKKGEIQSASSHYDKEARKLEDAKKAETDQVQGPIHEVERIAGSWNHVTPTLTNCLSEDKEVEKEPFLKRLDNIIRLWKPLSDHYDSLISQSDGMETAVSSLRTGWAFERPEPLLLKVPFWVVTLFKGLEIRNLIGWPATCDPTAPATKRTAGDTVNLYSDSCFLEIAPELQSMSMIFRESDLVLEAAKESSLLNAPDRVYAALKASNRLVSAGAITSQLQEYMFDYMRERGFGRKR